MSDSETQNLRNNTIIPTSISPWLSIRDVVRALDFYKSAFGAIEVYRMESPDGALQVAKLSVDGAEFWLGASSDHNALGIDSPGKNSIRMILTVTDPDAIFDQALKAGATQAFAVGEEYGWRLGRLIDPFGLHWEIGRPLTTTNF